MESELKKVLKECDAAQKEYDSFAEKFSNAEMELNFAKSSGDTARISEAQNVLANLEKESLTAGDNLNTLQERVTRLEEIIKEIKMDPSASQEVDEISKKLGIMESKLQSSKDKANNLKDELKQALNQKGNIHKTLDEAKDKVGSLGSKLKSAFSKGGNPLKSMSDKILDLNKKVEKFGKRITGLIASALIFNVLSNGLRNLASGFGSLLKSNSQFSSSLNQIKANLMTAFAPIYNYVLPAINALMSALSRITGAIAGFVSGLFGKTVEQSKKSAAALYGQAKAYDKAGKSAKKAGDNVASFDKLEIIGDKGDSSGGGQDDIDFSGPVQQSGKLLDFLNQIKELIANGQYFDVGMVIAESINKALASIDVVGFTNKIHSILQACVQVFNGFITGLDWSLLGTKFSQLVVGLTGAIADAIKAIDWSALGKGISDFIASIDWAQLTTNVISIFTNAFVGLTELITSIDWSMVGQKLGEAIISGLNTIADAIEQIDWGKVGESIKNFLCGIDWSGIFSALIEVIKNIVGGIDEFLTAIFGEGGATTIEAIAIAIGLVAGALALYNAATAIAAVVTTALTSPVTLVIALIAALVAIIILCVKHWDEIKETAVKCWEWIKETWSKAGEWFNNTIIQPIKDFFTGMWNGLKEGAKNAWEGIKSVFSKVTNWFKDVFSRAWQAVKNVFSTGGKIFDGIKEGIANVFRTVVNGIIGGINKVISVPFKAINGMLNTIRNVSILGVSPFKGFWKQNPLSVPQIPMLAQGAVIPPNAKFAAILGDQRNGRNLEAPEKLIRQIVREETGDRDVIFNGTFVVQCEGIELGRASLKGLRLMEQKNGKKYLLN